MFYLINKPTGITSHDVIYKMRKALGIKKIGHAGTLDPLATGLMIVAVGNDTKLLEYVVGLDKKYVCSFNFGATSSTYDSEGKIETIEHAPHIQKKDLERVLQEFSGDIYQTPPQFSAIKIQGKKAYEYARAGQTITIPARMISIFSIQLISFSYPEATIAIHCSSGTYIRSLVHDIGKRLNTGAYVTALARTAVGGSSIEKAIMLDEINKESTPTDFKSICPQYEYYELNEEEFRKVHMGQAIISKKNNLNTTILGTYQNQITTVFNYDPQKNTLHPTKNLHPRQS